MDSTKRAFHVTLILKIVKIVHAQDEQGRQDKIESKLFENLFQVFFWNYVSDDFIGSVHKLCSSIKWGLNQKKTLEMSYRVSKFRLITNILYGRFLWDFVLLFASFPLSLYYEKRSQGRLELFCFCINDFSFWISVVSYYLEKEIKF